MSRHPSERRSDWLQIVTVTNAAATARTSKPSPPQHFKAASSAFPLLHRNSPLPQTLPQTGVSSIGHFHFPALFLNLSPVKLANQARAEAPQSPEEDQLAAEMPKPKPLRHHHPEFTLLPWFLGWEWRQHQQNMPGSHFDCAEGTKNTQATSLWTDVSVHHLQNNSGRDTNHRFHLFQELAIKNDTWCWQSDVRVLRRFSWICYIVMGFSAKLSDPHGSDQRSCDLAVLLRFAGILHPATCEPGILCYKVV